MVQLVAVRLDECGQACIDSASSAHWNVSLAYRWGSQVDETELDSRNDFDFDLFGSLCNSDFPFPPTYFMAEAIRHCI
jgi:hypothetical protein